MWRFHVVKSQQSLKLQILDYVFYVFLKCRFKKRKKSRFWIFKKRKKTYSWTMVPGYVMICPPESCAQKIQKFRQSCVQFGLLGRPEPPFRTGLCFTEDVFLFYFFRHAFSEIPRPIALKLCHMVGIWLNFINWLQKFGECSRKKFWGQKHAKFRSILDHFRLWSRISPERGNISKIGKTYELGKFLLGLTKKIRWTLVH